MKKINSALISVFYKDGLDEIVKLLDDLGVEFTQQEEPLILLPNLELKQKQLSRLPPMHPSWVEG